MQTQYTPMDVLVSTEMTHRALITYGTNTNKHQNTATQIHRESNKQSRANQEKVHRDAWKCIEMQEQEKAKGDTAKCEGPLKENTRASREQAKQAEYVDKNGATANRAIAGTDDISITAPGACNKAHR